MIVVWPDTNSLFHDPFMRRNDAKSVLNRLAPSACELHMSPVVSRERRRQLDEQIQTSVDGLKRAAAKTARFIGADAKTVTDAHEAFNEAMQSALNASLTELEATPGMRRGTWPRVTTRELVQRDLERRRPFMQKAPGSIGFREVLIWEGLLNLLVDDATVTAVFVTADNGFLDESGGLHEDLLDDLCDLGIDPERVRARKPLNAAKRTTSP